MYLTNTLKKGNDMKAKIKATGEIIELHPYDEVYEKQKEPFKSKRHKICHLEGIEIFDEPDYWTRLKHQYAGMAMQGLITRNGYVNYTEEEMAKWCLDVAHALVEKLKEKEE